MKSKLELENIVHCSHDMTPWETTRVMLLNTPRFGELRSCRCCDAEQAITVAGSASHEELAIPCPSNKKSGR